jgi:two-component system, sensor histidine kinase and response regulator
MAKQKMTTATESIIPNPPEPSTHSRLQEPLVLKSSGKLSGMSEEAIMQYIHDLESRIVEQEQEISRLSHKEMEVARKNEELLTVISEKDRFFTIIAHDLRNPLQSLKGFIQILHEELETLTPEDLKEIIRHIRSSTNKFSDLLENLLLWTRMQRGMTHFNPEVVQLLPIINESISRISESAHNKGIDLTCRISDDLKVFADVNMLHTILRNLISNAIKFTSSGGSISVSAKANEKNNIEISVVDTGIGMSPDMVNRLFKTDTGTGTTGSDGENGTGLGLIICRDFIENQNGKFWVKSELGKGSVFCFTLPVNN